jgi:hypothetical protein
VEVAQAEARSRFAQTGFAALLELPETFPAKFPSMVMRPAADFLSAGSSPALTSLNLLTALHKSQAAALHHL